MRKTCSSGLGKDALTARLMLLRSQLGPYYVTLKISAGRINWISAKTAHDFWEDDEFEGTEQLLRLRKIKIKASRRLSYIG